MLVTTVNEETEACCGLGIIGFCMESDSTTEIDVLVVCKRPVDFNLPLRIDDIKALSSVCITYTGDMNFKERVPICTALQVKMFDFHAEFDEQHYLG